MYAWVLLQLGVRSWGFALLMLVLAYLIWRSVTGGEYTLLWIYLGLLVAIYGGAVLVSVLNKKNRRAYAPVKYSFDQSGVVKTAGTATQRVGWESIVRWRKVGAYYLIYQSRRGFFVIPRAKVPDGRVYDFEGLLSRNVVKRRAGPARR